MLARAFLASLAACLALASTGALAAASAVAVSPLKVGVAAGENHVFSARFFTATGAPAVGETVNFSNDACGRWPNGQFVASTTTDANGVASLNFNALQVGSIRCTVFAVAGAQVRYEVLTYPLGTAYISATMEPAEPRPGQPFTVSARAKVGIYDIYNADISARVIPGTASASISPTTTNSGQDGGVNFTVTPAGLLGDYQVEIDFRGRTQRLSLKPPANPWQDLWWSGMTENGWGMSIVQHRDELFAIIYAYDENEQPIWYVVPSGTWNEAHTAFSGTAYIPKGSSFKGYDGSKFDIGAPVGNVTIAFNNLANFASLDYTINGVSGRKQITRIPFGEGGAAQPNVGDLWWGGVLQNGWGLAVLQQGRTLFSLWFTYDDFGKATWMVMPGGFWADAKTYQGRIYKPTGSPWLGHTYDVTKHRVADIGMYQLVFSEDGTGTFRYYFPGGGMLSTPITRIPF